MKDNLCDSFLYGNRQPEYYAEKVLLHTAQIYGICRHIPDIWRIIIYDLLTDRSVVKLAEQLGLSQRTIGRLMRSETATPNLENSLKLLLLYTNERPKKIAKLISANMTKVTH